ncbi:hypothetical protein CsSME_00023427 [Camellia sinensis var. sinensis]
MYFSAADRGEMMSMVYNWPADQMEVEYWVSVILDCMYDIYSTYIMQITDPIFQMYIYADNAPTLSDNSELLVVEAKLSWIVHIIAAILKTKQFSGVSVESYEIRDAELSARVLRLINVTDSRLHSIDRKNGHLISCSFLVLHGN